MKLECRTCGRQFPDHEAASRHRDNSFACQYSEFDIVKEPPTNEQLALESAREALRVLSTPIDPGLKVLGGASIVVLNQANAERLLAAAFTVIFECASKGKQ